MVYPHCWPMLTPNSTTWIPDTIGHCIYVMTCAYSGNKNYVKPLELPGFLHSAEVILQHFSKAQL